MKSQIRISGILKNAESSHGPPETHLVAGYGSRYGHIEGLCPVGSALGRRRYIDPADGFVKQGGRHSVTLAAHYDKGAVCLQWHCADVFSSFKGCGVDRYACCTAVPSKMHQVADSGFLSEDGTHRGLYGLGIVQVRAVRRQVDCLYSEPIGQTQDGPDISRVADRVQPETQAGGQCGGAVRNSVRRDAQDGKGRGGGGEKAHASHELFSDVCGTVDRFNGKTLLSQGLPDHFLPFDDEKPVLLPELLLSEGADKPDVGLGGYKVGKHCPAELPSISQDLEHRLVGLLLAEELGGIVPVRGLVDDDMLGSRLEAVLDASVTGY